MFSQTFISGKEGEVLEDESAVGRLFGPMPAMSLPPIRIRPSLGAQKAGDGAQDRGLAAAGRPEKAEEFAAIDTDIGVAHRHEIAKSDPEIDRALRRRPVSCSPSVRAVFRPLFVDAKVSSLSARICAEAMVKIDAGRRNTGLDPKLRHRFRGPGPAWRLCVDELVAVFGAHLGVPGSLRGPRVEVLQAVAWIGVSKIGFIGVAAC